MGDLRAQILTADDIASEIVDVPGWGVKVMVKALTGAQRARLMQAATRGGAIQFNKIYPDLVIASAHDPETGLPIFEATDRDALLSKSGAMLDVIATKALEVSGMTEAAQAEAKSEPEG